MAALSFCYGPPASEQYVYYAHRESATVSKLRDHCDHVSLSRGCQISLTTIKMKTSSLIDSTGYNLSMTGATKEVLMKARGDLLQQCELKIKLTLEIPLVESIPSDLFEDLQKKFFHVKIHVIQPKKNYSSLVSDNPAHVEIIGPQDKVEECRVQVLVLIDEMRNLKTQALELPLKLHYLIGGRKRCGLLPIIEETSTNIYFSSPFYRPSQDEGQEVNANVYITGEATQVKRVRNMLNKLAAQKLKSMYHKDTELATRKIDWLLLHRRDELRKIMHDNGAHIMFPIIGSGQTRVTISAENRVHAERTLRALHVQACSVYEACFYFDPQENSDLLGTLNSSLHLTAFVSDLSRISGSEVLYKPGLIKVLGPERAIRNAYQRLQELQVLQNSHKMTLFRLECSQDHRDFISGKKNGKINKIMRTSGAKIKFQPFLNDYNFLIEVDSTSFTKALDGLTLLQEELPAEISFYVPESYHKRIIGVGGKNIQRIMKKYGVFVKFSNTEEFASLGGYYNNEDNVVARTPMKNQINLDNLRHTVMELVQPRDRSYVTKKIKVPYLLHRELVHHQDSSETKHRVLWPESELAQNSVSILAPESHIPVAAHWLESIVPDIYDLYVSPSDIYPHLISSDSFQETIYSIETTYHIQVETQSDRIRLHLKMDQIENSLNKALHQLIDYLKAHGVLKSHPVQPIPYILAHPILPKNNLPWTPVTQEEYHIPHSMPDTNIIRSIFNDPLQEPIVHGFPRLASSNGIWTPSRF
ncbi:unnamed protein product [Rhizopus stolonifer]